MVYLYTTSYTPTSDSAPTLNIWSLLIEMSHSTMYIFILFLGGTEDKNMGLSMSVGILTIWNLGRQWRDPEAA